MLKRRIVASISTIDSSASSEDILAHQKEPYIGHFGACSRTTDYAVSSEDKGYFGISFFGTTDYRVLLLLIEHGTFWRLP